MALWEQFVSKVVYCGEYFDRETETYYLRARQYDPVIGRFLSDNVFYKRYA
jgi:RHS repeat-associated protein